MPLTRGQVDVGGVVFEVEPFEWPRSAWEVTELRVTREAGWRYLTPAAAASLRSQFNGAHGSTQKGLKGSVVQYAEGTGGPQVNVSDWRGNSGAFAYLPDNGLELREIAGSADDPEGPYHEAVLRLARMF